MQHQIFYDFQQHRLLNSLHPTEILYAESHENSAAHRKLIDVSPVVQKNISHFEREAFVFIVILILV